MQITPKARQNRKHQEERAKTYNICKKLQIQITRLKILKVLLREQSKLRFSIKNLKFEENPKNPEKPGKTKY